MDAAVRNVQERFKEELEWMRPLPFTPFQVAKVLPVSVRSTATVRVEGAWYSVPTHWARLDATAYVGVEEVHIVCRGEDVSHPRQRSGEKRIRYQHYLSELARKPQAVGAGQGPRRAINQQGAEAVGKALERALEAGDSTPLALIPAPVREVPGKVAVPPALMGYRVEAARASDYDALLMGGRHE